MRERLMGEVPVIQGVRKALKAPLEMLKSGDMRKFGGLLGLARRSQRQCWLEPKLRKRCLSSDAQYAERCELEGEQGKLELWTWGKGESGQLGLGDEETRKSPCLVRALSFSSSSKLAPGAGVLGSPAALAVPKREGTSRGTEVHHGAASVLTPLVRSMHSSSLAAVDQGVGIATGLFHSGLWTDGKLWTWGKGAGGRLGLGSEEPRYSPTQVSSLTGVKSVAYGGLHSAAIADGGSLYTWGFGGFGALGHGIYSKEMVPRKLTGEEWMDNVKHVAAGGSHTAAISASGELYTWGRDEGDGRLGHGGEGGSDDGAERFPIKVQALSTPVAAVSCGGFCTMALTPEGQLWSWGGNSNYELGRGHRRADWRPKPIPETESICIVQVACGGYHSVALTDDGKVITWGHGGHGQLGHGTLFSERVPRLVDALANEQVVSIASGGSWSAAVTEQGQLYTWGKNRDSQLGVPSLMDTHTTPVLVSFEENGKVTEDTKSYSSHVIGVSAGATHGLSLVYRVGRT